ncbi:MAG: hypothetical protein H6998_08695 [Hahellaceae bacterium]|nr:hypothetical protein [Hahellaceae bacterium]
MTLNLISKVTSYALFILIIVWGGAAAVGLIKYGFIPDKEVSVWVSVFGLILAITTVVLFGINILGINKIGVVLSSFFFGGIFYIGAKYALVFYVDMNSPKQTIISCKLSSHFYEKIGPSLYVTCPNVLEGEIYLRLGGELNKWYRLNGHKLHAGSLLILDTRQASAGYIVDNISFSKERHLGSE